MAKRSFVILSKERKSTANMKAMEHATMMTNLRKASNMAKNLSATPPSVKSSTANTNPKA